MFNESQCQAYLEKWQKILRLKDWDIKLEMVTKEWRKTGDVKIDQVGKAAIVLLNNNNPYIQNAEAVIIHELLHIKLYGMDQMIEELLTCVYGEDKDEPKHAFAYSQFMWLLEMTTEDLTKGYVELGADDKSMPFERIQKDADNEWEKDAYNE